SHDERRRLELLIDLEIARFAQGRISESIRGLGELFERSSLPLDVTARSIGRGWGAYAPFFDTELAAPPEMVELVESLVRLGGRSGFL
ncbi:MAG: hypothetical protein ACAH95_14060, partial [Fimbriimonas sp.]